MKTPKYFILAICLLSSLQGSAQIAIGIKGGYTKAWEDYGSILLPEDAEIHVAGFNLSALLYFPINDHLSIGTEPGYVQRGAACYPGWWNTGTDPIFEGDTRLFLNYIEAPIMVLGKASVIKEKLELFGKVGYGHSYLVTALREETDLTSDDPPTTTRLELAENSNLRRWDHGFYGSLGFGFPVGRSQFFIESSYYHGLKNADRFNASKNRSLNLNLGYLLEL